MDASSSTPPLAPLQGAPPWPILDPDTGRVMFLALSPDAVEGVWQSLARRATRQAMRQQSQVSGSNAT